MNFFLPGTASLVEILDKRVIVVLRDGRKLIGILRSFDQYANVVLEHAIERLFVEKIFSDIPLGLFLMRGDNIVFVGEMSVEKEKKQPLTQVSLDELLKTYGKITGELTPAIRESVMKKILKQNATSQIIEDVF